ncbi:MAG: hypothetical protein ACOCRK_08625 [bacterium]
MIKTKYIGVFLIVAILVSGLSLPGLADYCGTHYDNCSYDRPCVECHSDTVCTDWYVTSVDMAACLATCGLVCVPGGNLWGYSCSLGCSALCSKAAPKTCRNWEHYVHCYCEGDPIPNSFSQFDTEDEPVLYELHN